MISKYDNMIKAAVKDHMPGNDWRLIKAQLFQESALNPNAKSKAGALGIAQFMPGTWRDVKAEMGMPSHATPVIPEYAIPACCHYMHEQWDKWYAKREELDRYCLALASYNAGLGNILKAQKEASYASDYATIIKHLPEITGPDNARQTTDYVRKILTLWVNMTLYGRVP